MAQEWNKVVLKIALLHNVTFENKMMPVYLITVEGNYLATVRGDRYVDMIIKDVQDSNSDKEIIIVRT